MIIQENKLRKLDSIMISQSIKGFLLCLFIPMLSWAQPEFNYQQIKSANPDKDYYMLSKGQHVMIDEAKGKLKIEVNEFSNILYLTERGTRAARNTRRPMSSNSRRSVRTRGPVRGSPISGRLRPGSIMPGLFLFPPMPSRCLLSVRSVFFDVGKARQTRRPLLVP